MDTIVNCGRATVRTPGISMNGPQSRLALALV